MMTLRDNSGFPLHFEDDIPEDEKKFYVKFYPLIEQVANRVIHCTVCDQHIGTAPCQESLIRMHPVLKVTHCKKCHEFYNSGEFSKGEDGSELYCRWCGQGGEVYCCSKCPYVFCKSCIILNLSQNIINDIEENENWNCFVCAPKIMWPLRAQHWALMNFIEKQKKSILSKNYSDSEIRKLMTRDQSTCCSTKSSSSKRSSTKLSENASDSSCNSENSLTLKKRRTDKKYRRILPKPLLSDSDSCDGPPEPKKQKSNDEVVCTPDVLSMLQTENSTNSPQKNDSAIKEKQVQTQQKQTIVIPQKPKTLLQHVQRPPQQRQLSTQVQTQYTSVKIQTPQSSAAVQTHSSQQQPPPLIIRNYNGALRAVTPTVVTRKTVVGSRPPSASPGQTPVYHTINGFRIDLNSAAQHETFRLPNGKLIQVKRQGTTPSNISTTSAAQQTNAHTSAASVSLHNQVIRTHLNSRTTQPQTIITQQGSQTVQQISLQQPPQLATIRYSTTPSQTIAGNTTITATIPTQSGTVLLNGTAVQQVARTVPSNAQPVLTKQFFSATPLGQARSQLQSQIFTAMEQCQYLSGKIHSLTNSNAYKGVKNFTDVKELYIHLSYLFTYAIGRFKNLQEKCLEDMKKLGFTGDVATLQSGQRVAEKRNNDGDDDDIEIVEPKTTCIDLDSDNEDGQSANGKKNIKVKNQQEISKQSSAVIRSSLTPSPSLPASDSNLANKTSDGDIDTAARLLAGMLEVELHEGGEGSEEAGEKASSPSGSSNSGTSGLKKPRKKTTNKPNPHLLKQMELQQRERIQETIRCDTKLSSECSIVLEKLDGTKYCQPPEDFDGDEETRKEENESDEKQEVDKNKEDVIVEKSIDDEGELVNGISNEIMKISDDNKQLCDLDESVIDKILSETDTNLNLKESNIPKEFEEAEEKNTTENISQKEQSVDKEEILPEEIGEKKDIEDEEETLPEKIVEKEDIEDEERTLPGEIVNKNEEDESSKECINASATGDDDIKMGEGSNDDKKSVSDEKEKEEEKKNDEKEERKKDEKEEEKKENEVENNDNSLMDSIKSFDMIDESSKTQDSLFESISDATFDVTETLSTAEIENCLKFNEPSEKNECSSDNFLMESSLDSIALSEGTRTLNIDDNAVQCETENV